MLKSFLVSFFMCFLVVMSLSAQVKYRDLAADDIVVTGEVTSAYPPSLREILNYPIIGNTITAYHDTDVEDAYDWFLYETIPPPRLLYLGAGSSGVVSRIFFTGDDGHGDMGFFGFTRDNISNGLLRVWSDCGDVTNFFEVPEKGHLFELPFAAVAGMWFNPSNSSTAYFTERIDCFVTNQANLINHGLALELRFPIPYTNGVLIQIGYNANDIWEPRAPVYSTTVYTPGRLPNGLIKNYRLKSSRYNGKIDATNTLPIFVNEPSGRGVGAFLYFSAKSFTANQTDWVPIEGNWVFDTDGTHRDDPENGKYVVSGTEDILDVKKVYSWTNTREGDFTENAGTIRHTRRSDIFPRSYDMYANLISKPIYWNNGVIGCKPRYPGESAWFYVTFIYYQEIQ